MYFKIEVLERMVQSFAADKHNKTRRWFILSLVCLIMFTLIILIVLVATKVIDWNWITGYVISAVCSVSALVVIYYSYELLIKTENPYLYMLLFISRFGLYFIPFLLAVFVPNEVFSVFGVLIGLSPIILLPLMQGAQRVIVDRRTDNEIKQQ